MRFGEFVQATGATPKQIAHWARVIKFSSQLAPGHGYYRDYHESAVPKVKLLVDISKSFEGRLNVELLKEIFDRYEDGYVFLCGEVELSWRPNG